MHSFDPQLAAEFGVDEAILIQSFAFWISENRTSGRNIHEGRCWTYDSREKLCERHPYWKPHQIRRIVNSLVEQEVLITGNHATEVLDRRIWYAFRDEERFIGKVAGSKQESRFDETLKSNCQNTQNHLRESSNASDENDKCYKEQFQTALTNDSVPPPPLRAGLPGEEFEQAQALFGMHLPLLEDALGAITGAGRKELIDVFESYIRRGKCPTLEHLQFAVTDARGYAKTSGTVALNHLLTGLSKAIDPRTPRPNGHQRYSPGQPGTSSSAARTGRGSVTADQLREWDEDRPSVYR
jgi:hypothetical protein